MASSRYAPASREPGGGPPAIYIEQPSNRFDSGRSHGMHSSGFSPSSIPMPIPNRYRTAEDDAPPPLPPPKFLPGMPLPDFRHERGPSLDSNCSWEGPRRGSEQERTGYGRESGAPGGGPLRFPHKDEGYHSLNSTVSFGSQESLPKKLFMSHDQYQLNKSTLNEFDSSQLKKLDSRRTFDNYSPPRRSALSASAHEATSSRSELHPQQQLPQLSLPIRPSHKSFVDSPSRFTDTPLQAASYHEYGSPIEPPESDRALYPRAKRTNSGSIPDDMTVSTHSSVELNTEDGEIAEETSGMRKLYIGDHMMRSEYQTAGHKRRAVSPPGDEVPMQGFPGSVEFLRRREGAARASPTPRLTVIPQGSSLSSISSTGRSGSFASNISIPGSSMSSMNSYGRRSPGGISTGGLSPVDICNSPFNNPISLAHSPHSTLGRALPHQRNVSNESRGGTLASPRKVTEVPKSSLSKIQGGFRVCECCPKKPKRFETEEELRAHEAEKQYECSFCGNRFKNKNEAERHQNSLHVRRHSWSCSALLISGYDRAFHDSTSRPGEADTCGYCGEEFARTGGIGRARHPTELDWDERLRHLQEVHKFRECNSSKKFYRADHFRQHLKHSHAGTSGKWTNMLENACMLEEEPPQPPRR